MPPSQRLAYLLILGLLFLLVSRGQVRAQASPAAGSVSAIQGAVTITRSGKILTAAYGTPVQVGDRIDTAAKSQVTLTLTDGTQMDLTESTTIVVDQNDLNPDGSRAATQVSLMGGLLHSLVRHAPGNFPNYEVHTPNAVAAARGTDYTTDYIKGVERKEHSGCREYSDVAVYDGEVEVSNPQNPTAGSIKLKKGNKTTVPCGLLLAPAIAVGPLIGMGAAGAAAAGAVAGVAVAVSGGNNPSPVTPAQ